MNNFIYALADGICIGAIYALIALGYTMVYGIIKLINFAHGEFFMIGAYAGLGAYVLLPPGIGLWLALPLVLLVAGLAGAAIAVVAERLAYRPIRGRGRLTALLTAIGVSFFLQNIMTFVRDGDTQSFGGAVQALAEQQIALPGNLLFQSVKLAFIGIALGLMALLWYITRRTRLGRAMRATSQDLEAARLMGINVDRVIMCTFALGGFLAGVAGVLLGAKNNVEPFMGFMPGLIAFVAAVVGGIGSIPGAVAGGLVIGLLQQLVVWAGVPSGYMNVVTFLLLIVVLVVRPQGLLGRVQREKV